MHKQTLDKKGVRWYWQLQVLNNKEIKLASWGWGGSRISGEVAVGETLHCKGTGKFELKKGNRRDGGWDSFIKRITFEFVNNCKEILGRKECEIKIADTVGLKNSSI